MDIDSFKRVLTSFADEPADVDVSRGKVVAQLRDELIDADISYDREGRLIIREAGQEVGARSWIFHRVAKLPQLADRILASISPLRAPENPFVTPSGKVSADISDADLSDSVTEDAVETLTCIASKPIPGATSVVYITSDAGEGKTTVINRSARVQAERFKSKEVGSLIVPIPLSGRAFLTFDDAVVAALVNKLRFNYLYYDAFLNLVRMGAVVPAFDGYEEMLVEGSKGEAVSALGNLVQTLHSSGTVLIAARKAFFEYVSFKTQAKFLDAIGDRSAEFSRVELNRWDKNKFVEYGSKRGVSDSVEIFEAVAARLDEHHPLLTRAVLVRRLFDVAENAKDRKELAGLLGNNPHDYFFTFVDAIVKRESSEKWLDRVSGEVLEPLLSLEEHHLLLSQIAIEMWQTSSNSLRYDVLDVVVDLFCETRKKPPRVMRQIKERVRQHSLLSVDALRGQALGFDHADFQDFYLGEGLGQLLAKGSQAELHAFLSVNTVPSATLEQSIQYLLRRNLNLNQPLDIVIAINESEAGFSFCKENCSALALRLSEAVQDRSEVLVLRDLQLAVDSLRGRELRRVTFEACIFQPTRTVASVFEEVTFRDCQFERIETELDGGLKGCAFDDCDVESMRLVDQDDQSFDPAVIRRWISKAGGTEEPSQDADFSEDPLFKVLEKFLRSFLRSTHVDESFIRLRMGKIHGPIFFDEILPRLLDQRILEEVQWKGQGVQHRYKLAVSMSDVSQALERAGGTFEGFLAQVTG